MEWGLGRMVASFVLRLFLGVCVCVGGGGGGRGTFHCFLVKHTIN